MVRRWSSAVFSVATGAAAITWAAAGGLKAIADGRLLDAAAWLLTIGLVVWFVVAGVGLRIVRAMANRRTFTRHPSD